MERAIPKLPRELREKVESMLTPQALATLAAIAAIWGGSHLVGIGEVVDVVLIGWGAWTFGSEIGRVARDLCHFATVAATARNDEDIDRAADLFAAAIATIGVDGLTVILAHKAFKSAGEGGTSGGAAEEQAAQPVRANDFYDYPSKPPSTSMKSKDYYDPLPPPAPAPPPAPVAPPAFKTKAMNSHYVGENLTGNKVWGTQVKYLTDAERAAYKLEIRNGRIYDAKGQPFDTSDASSAHSGGGNAIFVMDQSGNFYASKVQVVGGFHHSSLLAGQPVAAAGEIQVENGVLKVITDKSGHYLPGRDLSQQALRSLQTDGVDTSAVQKVFIAPK